MTAQLTLHYTPDICARCGRSPWWHVNDTWAWGGGETLCADGAHSPNIREPARYQAGPPTITGIQQALPYAPNTPT